MPRIHDSDDKLTDAHRRLAQAVADLVSGDDWQAFLALAAKLHGYSTGAHGIFKDSECWPVRCSIEGR